MSRTSKADVCVVGAGVAGLLIADVLAAKGRRVIVLERGPRYTAQTKMDLLRRRFETLNAGADYNDTLDDRVRTRLTAGAPAPADAPPVPYDFGSLSAVGGTTLHWSGATPRPVTDDLRARSRFGYGRDWPISYRELEPWLLRAEHELGVAAAEDNPFASERSGPFPMPAHAPTSFERTTLVPVLEKLGWAPHSFPHAINSVDHQGRSACRSCRICDLCPSGARYSASEVHLPKLTGHSTAELWSSTQVRRLELSKKQDRVVAVHAINSDDRSETIIEASRVVLAMGAIETPRMLLLSKSDHFPNGLGNSGGQLGKGLSDHLMIQFWIRLKAPVGLSRAFPSIGSDYFRGPIRSAERLSHLFYMLAAPTDWDLTPPSTRIAWSSTPASLSLRALRESYSQSVFGFAQFECTDLGTLTLAAEERDGFGDPRPHVGIRMSELDRAGPAQFHGVQLPKLAEAMGAVAWGGGAMTPGSCSWGYHSSGSTAMAASADHGVCDPNLRVFGLDNLYLASGSVFPHNGCNNPTLTTAALALRLAHHLS